MRQFITILRENDEYSEFSTKGHAGMKARSNDPRFADNPMANVTELDEFDASTPRSTSEIDRLHDMFRDAEISDTEIKQGIQLTDEGLHKVAARLGVSPDEIRMLLLALAQQLRDADSEDDTLAESYRRFVEAEDDPRDPFDAAADQDHLSAESDYLGDITVRSSKQGNSKFLQGSQATDLAAKLKGADAQQKQALLRPLVEDDEEGSAPDFKAEINTDAGSYNFPWKLAGQVGFGTVFYALVDGKPALRLISVRDEAGDDVELDPQMRQQLLVQARNFIGDA